MRDAAAKAVYGRLFSWLIVQINRLLAPELSRAAAKNTIGALPIPPPPPRGVHWVVAVACEGASSDAHFISFRFACCLFPFLCPDPGLVFFFLCFLLLLL